MNDHCENMSFYLSNNSDLGIDLYLLQDNQEDEADSEVDEEAEVMEAQQRFCTRFDNTSDYSSGNEM